MNEGGKSRCVEDGFRHIGEVYWMGCIWGFDKNELWYCRIRISLLLYHSEYDVVIRAKLVLDSAFLLLAIDWISLGVACSHAVIFIELSVFYVI